MPTNCFSPSWLELIAGSRLPRKPEAGKDSILFAVYEARYNPIKRPN
jgi:hypothetical protein